MTATTSSSGDEILADRRVRAAELALEAARRRVVEAEEEIAGLRRQVTDLEERVLEAAARAGAEPARLAAELEAERRVRALADQALWVEREKSRRLEEELARRRDRTPATAAERQLAIAERRTRELESELELIRHRAAEFELQVRLAVDAAWRWLGETSTRVTGSLTELEVLRQDRAQPAPDSDDELLRGEPAGAGGEGALSQPSAQEEVIPRRFDEALSRLRAQVAPDPEPPA